MKPAEMRASVPQEVEDTENRQSPATSQRTFVPTGGADGNVPRDES
jgi:hypothetical protein